MADANSQALTAPKQRIRFSDRNDEGRVCTHTTLAHSNQLSSHATLNAACELPDANSPQSPTRFITTPTPAVFAQFVTFHERVVALLIGPA